MQHYIRVMKALSDPTRVKILKILQVKELCVCEIRSLLGFAQPTISKHLRLLEDAGLVESHKDKMWVNYSLSDGNVNAYALTALDNLHDWFGDDPEIKSLLETVPAISRDEVKRRPVTPGSNHPHKRLKTYFYPINNFTKENVS